MNDREFATVLAALRYWQREGWISGGHEHDIASDGGALEPLSKAEIDDLCARLGMEPDMQQSKYIKGEPFRDLSELLRWLEAGCWCYWHNRPKHPSVIENMSISTIKSGIRRGTLRPALESNPPAARYLITWRIDMDAESPEEAAAKALIVQRDNDPANSATVFEVTCPNGRIVTIDLQADRGA